MRFLFFIGAAFVATCFFIYPLWLALLGLFASRRPERRDIQPSVSLFLLDEGGKAGVAEKVGAVLALDYPRDKLEVLFGSDGADQAIYQEVKKIAEERNIRYAVSFQKIGRQAMINKLARDARGEIFVFLDARQKFEKAMLGNLVKSFADPDVGYVSAFSGWSAEGALFGFWRVREDALRRLESATGSLLIPTGSVYAVRHDFFKYLPAASAFSDAAYLLFNTIAADKRAVVEEAAGTQWPAGEVSPEKTFSGLVGVLLGDFQLFSLFTEIALSFKNRMSMRFLAHKVFPLALPYALLLIFFANIFLMGHGAPWGGLFIAQLSFYGMASAAHLTEQCGIRWAGFLRWPYEFCLYQLAAVMALRLFLSGQYAVRWEE